MPEQILYTDGQQLSLSMVRPDFLNEDLLEQPKTIYRYDDRSTRYYYKLNGRGYPIFGVSVSHFKDKVLGKPQGVIEKRISMGDEAFFSYVKNRQHFGTFFHIHTGIATKNGYYDFGDHGKNLHDSIRNFAESNDVEYTWPRHGKKAWFDDAWLGLLAWMKFLNDYEVKPLAIEISLMHPDGYSNTIDYVFEMNAKKYTNKTPKKNRKRIIAILDVKTGYIYPDHAFQLGCNWESFEHNYRDLKIDKVYNWTHREWWKKPSYELRDQTDNAITERRLLGEYLKIYKEKHYTKPRDIKVPNGRMAVGSDLSQNYRTIPIREFIKQKHMEL